MGVEFLAFIVLLHTKSEQKGINIINFVHPLYKKEIYFIHNLCWACLDCNRIYLIRKTDFNGLLKLYEFCGLAYLAVTLSACRTHL